MSLSKVSKQKIIEDFQTGQNDTGSPEVQVALLSRRIEQLTEHLKIHPHDIHSRRGLLSMLSKRRRLLNFLAERESDRYKMLIKKVNLPK